MQNQVVVRRARRRVRAPVLWGAMGATLCVLSALGSVVHPVVVLGHSMEPTLRAGQLIWMDRAHYLTHRPQRGEVIVFRHGGTTYVKRIYRCPGESLHVLAIGGFDVAPIQESNLPTLRDRLYRHPTNRIRRLTTPDDCVFVLGESTEFSIDSRTLGPIPLRAILGRAWVKADSQRLLAQEFRLPPRRSQESAGLQPTRPVPARDETSAPGNIVHFSTM